MLLLIHSNAIAQHRCLSSFAETLKVLQTAPNLRRVARELGLDLARSGVTYAEVRWCPSLHREQGLADRESVSAVAQGLTDAMNTLNKDKTLPKLHLYQILTCLRDLGAAEADRICKLAIDCSAHAELRVCGVDLAGNEHAHPPHKFAKVSTNIHARSNPRGHTCHLPHHEPHAQAFAQVAKLRGKLGITIHAGEGRGAQAQKHLHPRP